MTPADIRILARRHVGVSHNPESNMKLASGTSPVAAMRKAGVVVGLGTDGAASNNDLDMFEAMRQAAFLHKLQTSDPRALPARDALAMATIDGARALGMDREIGSLEAGQARRSASSSRWRRAADADVRSAVAPRLRHARRRCADDDRQRARSLMRDRKVLTLDEAAVLAEARAHGRATRSGASGGKW